MSRDPFKNMTEPMFYVLLALDSEERYGLDIVGWIKSLTDNRVILGPGTLYGLLSRFEQADLIYISRTQENRTYYKISKLGKEYLNDEVNRLHSVLHDYFQAKGEKQ